MTRMHAKLHDMRERIETTFEKTPTQIEGTMVDLAELGQLVRVGDQWRVATTSEMLQVLDDVNWWASSMRERIQFMEQQ